MKDTLNEREIEEILSGLGTELSKQRSEFMKARMDERAEGKFYDLEVEKIGEVKTINRRRRLWTVVRRLSTVAAVLVIMFAVTITVSEGARKVFFDGLFTEERGGIVINFLPADEEEIEYSGFVANYIPPGFDLLDAEKTEFVVAEQYKNGERYFTIMFTFDAGETVWNFDTDRHVMDIIEIGGHEVLIFKGEEHTILLVRKGKGAIEIIGGIDEDTAIKILRGIEMQE